MLYKFKLKENKIKQEKEWEEEVYYTSVKKRSLWTRSYEEVEYVLNLVDKQLNKMKDFNDSILCSWYIE